LPVAGSLKLMFVERPEVSNCVVDRTVDRFVDLGLLEFCIANAEAVGIDGDAVEAR